MVALPAFAGYGIELEYMTVNAATLDVAPLADVLLDGSTDVDRVPSVLGTLVPDTAIGLTAYPRKHFAPDAYVGVELEINHGHVLEGGGVWRGLRADVAASLRAALAGD